MTTCSLFSGDPIGGERTLALQKAVSGFVNLASTPSSGQVIYGIGVRWYDNFRAANGTPGVLRYDAPVKIRCDAQLNTGATRGCAVPTFTPGLALTGYGSGNASVALVYWFQYYGADHWGLYPNGTPLTRLNNSTQATANRDALCRSGAWVADPLVPTDSCDEFPFAGTYQSGNMLGLSASQCGQVRFSFDATTGGWTYYGYPGLNPSQRCVLGHVPLSDNQSVGGMYSSFIKNNRVLDKDPFWVGLA